MESRRNFNRLLVGGGGLLLLGAPPLRGWAAGPGDLSLAPVRVVLPPSQRAATVFVINQGRAANLYSVELVDRLMNPEGQIRSLSDLKDDPDAAARQARLLSARDLIAYSPRRISLASGESQTIRIRAQRPSELKEGEYRTHLTITQLPPENSGTTAEQAAARQPETIGIAVRALFGATIPVIVRHGAVAASASVNSLEHVPPTKDAPHGLLKLVVARQGSASLYGDVMATASGAGPGAPPLATAKGVAVYPEVDGRRFELPLARRLAPGETVEVAFVDQDQRAGRVLATARYTVG